MRVDLAAENEGLRAENAALRQHIAELEEQVAKLEAELGRSANVRRTPTRSDNPSARKPQ
jgi:hypothetical protein